MTEWLVGFRDGSTIDHSEHKSQSDRTEYSDLPRRYREMRRYNGPADGPHGYLAVTNGMDGSRGIVPTRPISLEHARWHRDWMLRGYFDSVERYLRNPRWAILPQLPVIVRLDPVDEEPADEEPVEE